MPNFIIIDSNKRSSISDKGWIQNGWENSEKFSSKNRIVDKAGKAPSSDYKGNQYEIISKRQRDLSYLERFGRGFLGTLIVTSSLGIALLSKTVLKLFTKQKQSIRFGALLLPLDNLPKHKNEDYNISKKELQQGISISKETVSKVQHILQRKQKQAAITFYGAGKNNYLVFGLDTEPELIFKVTLSPVEDISLNDRYKNMIFAKTVIRTHQLGLLIIPNAKLFSVTIKDKKYAVIAEQKMNIDQDINIQEQLFLGCADSLNEAVCQLALFICETGYSDVEWRNNPILNNSLDEKKNRKIVLVDLEELDSSEVGLFGEKNRRTGLVGCVNEKQGKMVEAIAKERGVPTSLFEGAYSRRKEELEEGRKLKEFYAKKRITKGNEPIKIDESSLNFPTDSEIEKKLKELTLDLIQRINAVIAEGSSGAAIKERRSVYINIHSERFQHASTTLVYPDKKTDEKGNSTFLDCAIKKLKNLGAIYKAELYGAECYLQA